MEKNGIYYEERGSGPLLLLIPGGSGDADPYAPLSQLLADRFTAVAYDRRGFSRSSLAGPLDKRFDQDVKDAAYLIEELGGGSADVFGSSSGAILAFELATRRPELVRHVVAHEPPLVTLLPDGREWLDFFDQVHAKAAESGVTEAMRFFGERVGMGVGPSIPHGVELPLPVREMLDRMQHNLAFFIENELRQYASAQPDFDALARLGDRLILAGGADSRDHVPYRPNLVIAERLGLAVHDLPGDHIGYAQQAAEFAPALMKLLT
jgi:pimeloyl-ACP methyl ester carboxylesterase